jgi:hypothetical protein
MHALSSARRLPLDCLAVDEACVPACTAARVLQMGELRPYRQGLLDATQAVSRLLTVAIFLCIGISNALVFGPSLQVCLSRPLAHQHNTASACAACCSSSPQQLSCSCRLALLCCQSSW